MCCTAWYDAGYDNQHWQCCRQIKSGCPRERQDDGWLNQYTAKVFGNELRT
ncbi:hypothetical protein [Snodgrassella sp. ESL0324]|uniref:hypothetical protein n=1 Tax=Snodgrassella sp. ESL0324 TaxID=2705033 RepID=UPI001583E241|nr:hypothetical protein [Snodgrassella sp. ESL0324]NUF09738.1 hypothetical protein [Snodgrassella sp. ESL0324]